MGEHRLFRSVVTGSAILCILSIFLFGLCRGDAAGTDPQEPGTNTGQDHEGVYEAAKGKTKTIYIKVPDGKGMIEKRLPEGENWTTQNSVGNVWSREYLDRFNVNGNLLVARVGAVVASLASDGYHITAVVPIARGYSRESQPIWQDGGGWGFGVSPTDGVLIVGTR
jgi:hypothetical protein